MSTQPVPKRSAQRGGLHIPISDRQDAVVDLAGLAAVARRTLEGEGISRGELSLSLVGEDEMAQLHQRFMGEPGPTDVLSFPMGDEDLLGDVVVCPAQAARNNADDVAGELRLLVAHGVLHILGFDHEDEEDRAQMWDRQERYSGTRIP
jgi:probable rRNA maturation factor